MFSSQNSKIKLVYMGFGGMIAIVGMLFAFGMLSSVTAQRDRFDTIQCSRLKVVDADGRVRVILSTDFFDMAPVGNNRGNNRVCIVGTESHGGYVGAYGNDGKSAMCIGSFDGIVEVKSKFGNSTAALGTDPHGGHVLTSDRYGNRKLLD